MGAPESTRTRGRPPERNPSITAEGLEFDKLNNSKGDVWARCNIYANWLLQAAMESVGWKFNGVKGSAALRRVEAALFMIGYDFPDREKEEIKNADSRSTIDNKLRRAVKQCKEMVSKNPVLQKKN